MKKRISILVCAMALALSFTGCGSKNAVNYDEAALAESCDQVFSIVESDTITNEQVGSMSAWNQGYLMAQFESQTGVKMEADSLVTALEAWQSSVEECGDYVEHGDYTFKASSTGVVVSAEAEFTERTAELSFKFDENMNLESLDVNAHYETGEILKKAGMNTLIGMGTVFVVLIFMSAIISLIKYIPALFDKSAKQVKPESAAEVIPTRPAVETAAEAMDDTELVAVIAAAIAAYEGTGTDGFVVRSVRRRKSNKWNA